MCEERSTRYSVGGLLPSPDTTGRVKGQVPVCGLELSVDVTDFPASQKLFFFSNSAAMPLGMRVNIRIAK